MGECREGATYICHLGLQRSRATAEALRSKGIKAKHFEGGTDRLTKLSPNEIKKELGKSPVTLIYDMSGSDDQFNNKEKALEKLKAAGIKPDVVDIATIAACLHDNGLDINDFLY